jgi:trimeric autotransporter adhesin
MTQTSLGGLESFAAAFRVEGLFSGHRWRMCMTALLGVVLSVLDLPAAASAQCQARWLPGPGLPGQSVSSSSLIELPSGEVLVGKTVSPLTGDNFVDQIAKFNPASGVWTDVAGGVLVRKMFPLPNGDIIIGGSFFSVGGVLANRIARYRPSTGVFTPLGAGIEVSPASDWATVEDVALLPDGSLLVGGSFNIAGGVAGRTNLARVNLNTGVWSSFAGGGFSPFVNGTRPIVNSLCVLPSGEVVVAGYFTMDFSVPGRNNIAIYNPTTGLWRSLGGGVNGSVADLHVLPGGDLLVAGGFTTAGSIAANGIARFNPVTNVWTALGSGLTSGTSPFVRRLTPLPTGDILVTGWFTTAGGAPSVGIARYNPVSRVWTGVPSTSSTPTAVSAAEAILLPGGSGEVVLSGGFTLPGAASSVPIARVNLNTGDWVFPGRERTRPNGTVRAMSARSSVIGSSEYYVGGDFIFAGNTTVNRIAKFNLTTGVWSPLGSGVWLRGSSSENPTVAAVVALPNDDVIIAGRFNVAGDANVSNIARYRPSTGTWSSLGSGIGSSVNAMALLPGGDLMVGGSFSTIGNPLMRGIARVNPVTNVWSSVGSGINGTVSALLVLPGGDVIVGGSFSSVGTLSSAQNIVRFSPATGVWSPLGQGVNGSVSAIAVQPDGVLVVGGSFTSAGSTPANRIARFDPIANQWSALGSGVTSGRVLSIVVRPSGRIVAGGDFLNVGGSSMSYVAEYDPASDAWSSMIGGLNSPVRVMATVPNAGVGQAELLLGGSFFYPSLSNPSSMFTGYTFGTPPPTVGSQVLSTSLCTGADAIISVVPTGTGPFTYQWRKNGVAIDTLANPTAASANLLLVSVTASDVAVYDCVISTPCGSVTSAPSPLTLLTCACNPSDVAGANQSIGADGALKADDIIVHLGWFFASDARADVAGPNQSTAPDTEFTADDIIVFLGRYFAGC